MKKLITITLAALLTACGSGVIETTETAVKSDVATSTIEPLQAVNEPLVIKPHPIVIEPTLVKKPVELPEISIETPIEPLLPVCTPRGNGTWYCQGEPPEIQCSTSITIGCVQPCSSNLECETRPLPSCLRDYTVRLVYIEPYWIDNCGRKYGWQ